MAATNFSDLNDDLLEEVLTRMPLRYAIRCSTLSRSLRAVVHHPQFLARRLARFGPIFLHFSGYDANQRLFSRTPKLQQHPNPVIIQNRIDILASCNGVLLLRHINSLYVFNPASGGIARVATKFHQPAGLAADDHSGISVALLHLTDNKLWVDLIRLSSNSFVVDKSHEQILRRRFTLSDEVNLRRAAYGYGSLHWIDSTGKRILVYHIASRRCEIVPGPLHDSTTGPIGFQRGESTFYAWFGFADNKLQFVINRRSKIAIYAHDHRRNRWQMTHTINNRKCSDAMYQRTMFFDGRSVFQMVRLKTGAGKLYSYDMVQDEWSEIGEIKFWENHNLSFIHYSPSLVKVPGENVRRSCRYGPTLKNTCRKLQGLLDNS